MKSESPIRILATAYDYRPRLGGIATFAFELLLALEKIKGVSVQLIAPDAPEGAEFDRQSGVPTRRVKLSKQPSLAAGQLIAPLLREIHTFRPTHILNFLWFPESVAALAVSRLSLGNKIPYHTIVHGLEILDSNVTLKKRLKKTLAPLRRLALTQANLLIANSRFTEKVLRKIPGVSSARTRVLNLGVNTARFFPEKPAADLRQKYNLKDQRVFLTVSRLDDYKGIDTAIEALAKIKAENPNFIYLVGGEGNDLSRLEALVKKNGLDQHVIFTGAIPESRIRDYYNLCDVFVLLSREDWITPNFEGFGLVFLEAAACAKPSIAGLSGGIGDAVSSETGWLVDPTDLSAVSKLFRLLIADPELAKIKGIAARQDAEANRTWEKVADHFLEMVNQPGANHVRD